MKKLLWLLLPALAAYGAWDLVREVRGAWTSDYSRTYSRAVGQTMSRAFDSLNLSGRGVRIGVLDAGFGGFRTDRWTRGLHVAAWRDFTGGDETAFFDDATDHGTRVCTNLGGRSGDTIRGLAWGAEYYLAKTDRAEVEPRAEERQLIRGIEWLLAHDVDVISSSLGYTTFDDFSGYTPAMLDGRTSTLSRYLERRQRGRQGVAQCLLSGRCPAGHHGRFVRFRRCFPLPLQWCRTRRCRLCEARFRRRSLAVGNFVFDAGYRGALRLPARIPSYGTRRTHRTAARFRHAGRSSRLRTGLRHPANRCFAPNAPHAMTNTDLKELLDALHDKYNSPDFIADDPISVPHRYTDRADREIAGFFSATIAWGNRKAIVRSGHRMMHFMDDAPADFVRNASQRELALLSSYVHRTFNGGDLRDFVLALRRMEERHGGIGNFFETRYEAAQSMPAVLADFRREFFAGEHAPRCEKHVSSVERGAACKRLCMYLRWMVRRDDRGVDFGLWRRIPMSALYLPLDVHVGETARALGLLGRRQNDWRAVEELTDALRAFDAEDPARYDFSLFGAGMDGYLNEQ